jgi:hypothetical protein
VSPAGSKPDLDSRTVCCDFGSSGTVVSGDPMESDVCAGPQGCVNGSRQRRKLRDHCFGRNTFSRHGPKRRRPTLPEESIDDPVRSSVDGQVDDPPSSVLVQGTRRDGKDENYSHNQDEWCQQPHRWEPETCALHDASMLTRGLSRSASLPATGTLRAACDNDHEEHSPRLTDGGPDPHHGGLSPHTDTVRPGRAGSRRTETGCTGEP